MHNQCLDSYHDADSSIFTSWYLARSGPAKTLFCRFYQAAGIMPEVILVLSRLAHASSLRMDPATARTNQHLFDKIICPTGYGYS
jgi:hypothetical protein